MEDNINFSSPEDWGISSKESWVSFEELKDNGAPTLEGRDVVGFIEFAQVKLAPNKPKDAMVWKDINGRPVAYNQSTKAWYHTDQSGRKDLKNKLQGRSQIPQKAPVSKQSPKPQSQEKQTTQEKPKESPATLIDKKSKDSKSPTQTSSTSSGTSANKNLDGSISNGDIDIATNESLVRVEEIANTPSDDSRFDGGRVSNKRFTEHFSQKSDNFEGLQVLSKSIAVANNREKTNALIDAVKSGDLDREIPLTKKESRTVGDLLQAAGIDVNNKEELDSFAKAYDAIAGFIGDNGKWKTGESHELTGSNLGYFEAKHIEKRSDLAKENVGGIQAKAFNLSKENNSELADLDPRITEAIYHLLPAPSREFLAKSGSPKTFYDPTAPNQQGKNPNPIRGAASLHMWTMQDGISAYSMSGQRRSPGEFQVEHVIPLKSGGSDHINNFALILRRENEPRADLPFQKFLEQAKRKAEDVKTDLNSPEVKEEFERRYRAASFNAELAPVMGGSVGNLINDSIVSGVNEGLVKGLGEEGAQNLKFSSEGWDKYKSEITEFLQKNRINADAKLENLSGDQLDGIFEIMKDNLGVEKEKMIEYMGRAIYNNYDLGVRHVIDKSGALQEGRGGTMSSPGSLLNMQNLVLTQDGMTSEQTQNVVSTIRDLHQSLKKSRTEFIRNSSNPDAYEKYLDSVVENITYLTGVGENSPLKNRQYDNRFTASNRNNIHSDTANTILNLLSLDTASVAGGKDALSPGYQKNLTEKTKENIKTLSNFLISSYVKTSGLSPEEIKNPGTLTKTKRKPIEPLLAALENMNRGINS